MLTKVEQAILEILADYCGAEVMAQDLRTLLQNRGFRRSAPSFVFTVMNLVDKGLVVCREDIRKVSGVEIKDRYFCLTEAPRGEND
jgi:hypothetical protein